MSNSNAPSPLRVADYEAIETALLETVRGRWFLSEYSKRNRSADTSMLLDAISKLEATVLQPKGEDVTSAMRHDLIEMAEAISQTRQEIASMRSPEQEDCQFTTATEELDAIVEATEKATSDILEAAEDVQEIAWLLREKDVEDEACDRLDARATDIYTACSFQDLTGQRTSKVVRTLRFLEKRVLSMIDIWGLDDIVAQERPLDDEDRPDAHLLNGPALGDQGVGQSDVDEMLRGIPPEEISIDQDMAADNTAPATMEAEPLATAAQIAEPAVPQSNDADSAEAASTVRQTLAAEIEAKDFSAPADLEVDQLGEVEKTALFS